MKYQFVALIDNNVAQLGVKYNKNINSLFFNDVEDALQVVDFDVAIVCVPHYQHFHITMPLLQKNKFIIKEKPLALNKHDLQHYKQNSGDKNLLTIVQRQFNKVFFNAKKDLMLIGKPYSYKYEYSLKIPEVTQGWRSDKICSGGGVLLDMGYHILDIVLHFFGEVVQISGSMSYCYDLMKKEELEDSAAICLYHKNAQIQGIIYLNRHLSYKKEELEIIGDQGTILITPRFYKIFNRTGELIKEFSIEDFDNNAIKLQMFESHIQNSQNIEYVGNHFRHHEAITCLIDEFYSIVRRRL
jgi:predicted dehydrogenase